MKYTLQKTSGAWEIFHAGTRVRTFFTEAVARCYVRAWNENRQPRPQEIAAAISA